MNIVLISTYELGRQPFGLASPAAWLRAHGHRVTCLDLSRQGLDEAALRDAKLVAFYVPMHTATRLTLELAPALRRSNATAHFCAYGLYAPLAQESLRAAGVQSLVGGEFEQALVDLVEGLGVDSDFEDISRARNEVSLKRLAFVTPDRAGMPALQNYAHLILPNGEHSVAGYTEASRGCKHLCRHCPIVPVYNGVFRVVDREVVLSDIRQQVAAGARHISFGDPDFFNGVGHAIPLVEKLHGEFPELTYDVTIKVEHLRKHADLLPKLRQTGCLIVISAVESLDALTLDRLQKNHTREDFLRVVEGCRRADIALQPTFVPFTPWTTAGNYLDLLEQVRRLDLIEAVAPIQLAIRLLIPPGSRLLELKEISESVGAFDPKRLVYPWKHENPDVDGLAERLQQIVASAEKKKQTRAATFEQIWRTAHDAFGRRADNGTILPDDLLAPLYFASPTTVPYLNEPWYC